MTSRSATRGLQGRPIARAVLILALLLLGGVAATRLALDYLPTFAFPELRVSLELPRGIDPDTMNRRYLLPLESAIRSVGEVRAIGGEVHARGVSFRILLEAGTDSESKAARLDSEFAVLRQDLPSGSRLEAWPVVRGADNLSAVLWFGADVEIDPNWLASIRARPEIRAVTLAGSASQEIHITPRDNHTSVGDLRRALDRQRHIEPLGEWTSGDRQLPVHLQPPPSVGFSNLRIERQGRWLADATRASLVPAEAPWQARVDGEEGRAVWIDREFDASPITVERVLRQSLRRFDLEDRVRILLAEAEPLKDWLRRLVLALLTGMVLSALVAVGLAGRRAGGIQITALPIALAAMFNGLWLFDLPLDITTLPILVTSLAICALVQALRPERPSPVLGLDATVCALLPAVAVALAAGALAPALRPSAQAFAICVASGVWALHLLPPLPRPRAVRQIRQPWRVTLRYSGTVLLGVATLASTSLVLTGDALSPRGGALAPTQGDLAVQLTFSEGTTPSQAAARIERVEDELRRHQEIVSWWCIYNRQQATLSAEVDPESRRQSRLRTLAARLNLQLSSVAAASRVFPLGAGRDSRGRQVRYVDTLQDESETDKAATRYKLILRGTDLSLLRQAHRDVLDALVSLRTDRRRIWSDWGAPIVRLEASPRPGAAPAQITEALNLVRRRAYRNPPQVLDATRRIQLRLVDTEAPSTDNEVRHRHALLAPGWAESASGELVRPGDVLQLNEVLSSPNIKRQAGRFVLPITVDIFGSVAGYRIGVRNVLHRRLTLLPMPTGVELDLPQLDPNYWNEDRLRLLAITLAFPLLLLAWASSRLNSVIGGLLIIATLTASIALITPMIRFTSEETDELTLMIAVTILAGLLVMLHTVAARLGRGVDNISISISYRWLIDRGPWILNAALAGAALLFLPGWGLEAERHPWMNPMRVGALLWLGGCIAGCFFLPAAIRGIRYVKERQRDGFYTLAYLKAATASPAPSISNAEDLTRSLSRAEPIARTVSRAETVANPPAWRESGQVSLSVRSLAKVYDNGFCAIRGIDFSLEPGIIGLLGPNGAGKTTLLRLLCGLLEPSRGSVAFRGVHIHSDNLPRYRHLVGFLPQDFNAYPGFTVERFLNYWALERGLTSARERRHEIDRVLHQVALADAAGKKVRNLSGGMRRRIGIARALLGSPPILIVDEPTTGLDIESRNRLREALLTVASERIVIFSTHIASDIAATASRILLLHGGTLRFDGPASDLIAQARGRVFEAILRDDELRAFQNRFRVTARVRTRDGVRVRAVTPASQEPPGRILEPQLEEAYLTVIGELEPGRQDLSRRKQHSWVDIDLWRS